MRYCKDLQELNTEFVDWNEVYVLIYTRKQSPKIRIALPLLQHSKTSLVAGAKENGRLNIILICVHRTDIRHIQSDLEFTFRFPLHQCIPEIVHRITTSLIKQSTDDPGIFRFVKSVRVCFL